MKALEASTRIQLKHILFATDFSPAALAAVPYAAELATRYAAKMHVLHVRPPVVNPMPDPSSWARLEEAFKIQDTQHIEELNKAFPGMQLDISIEEGALWPNIESEIKKNHIDLIVMGTHGRSGIGKFLLGSAAEEVFRKAPCSVLTVGPEAATIHKAGGSISRILFATDFSLESGAVRYALSLAQEYQAHLTLLHVVEEPKANELVHPAELMKSSEGLLSKLMPEEAKMWCVPDYLVKVGPVAQTILDVAAHRNVDLIVLGVRPAGGFPGAASHLATATAHKVVSKAACPVLTVRHNSTGT